MNPILKKLMQNMCKCEDQCSCKRPTDSELERLTGEPHFAGYPLQSGIPPAQSSGDHLRQSNGLHALQPARDMNATINELAEQAGAVIRTKFGKPVNLYELEKFADLIIRECVKTLKKDMELAHIQLIPLDFKMYANGRIQRTIKEHFGVE